MFTGLTVIFPGSGDFTIQLSVRPGNCRVSENTFQKIHNATVVKFEILVLDSINIPNQSLFSLQYIEKEWKDLQRFYYLENIKLVYTFVVYLINIQ